MSDRPRDRPDDDETAPLPDGVVPLPPLRDAPKQPGGCGLTGCLYGTVGIFAVLLVILIFVALTRVWMTPAVGR